MGDLLLSIDVERYVEQRIGELEKILSERCKAEQKALKIATKETHRRLDLLNGEAERLREMQVTYYPREMATELEKRIQRNTEDLNKFVSRDEWATAHRLLGDRVSSEDGSLNERLNALQVSSNTLSSRTGYVNSASMLVVIGIVTSILVTIIVHFWTH